VFVDGQRVFELGERANCAGRDERDGEQNIQTQIKKFDKLERNCREECRSHWTDGGTQRVEGGAQWRANTAR